MCTNGGTQITGATQLQAFPRERGAKVEEHDCGICTRSHLVAWRWLLRRGVRGQASWTVTEGSNRPSHTARKPEMQAERHGSYSSRTCLQMELLSNPIG